MKNSSDIQQSDTQLRPATWGQRHIWGVYEAHCHQTRLFTLRRLWKIAPSCDIKAVEDAVHALVKRYEALRMSVHRKDGLLVQQVQESSEPLIPVSDSAYSRNEREAYETTPCQSSEPCVDGSGTSAEFTILSVHGSPEWLHIALPHTVADTYALDVLERDFQNLLETSGNTDCYRPQPSEWHLREASHTGQRANKNSIDFICDVLSAHPQHPLPVPKTGGTKPGFNVILGSSTDLGLHLESIAKEHRLSASAIAFTAVARAISKSTGTESFALGITASNRFLPDSKNYVGMLAQNGVAGFVNNGSTPLELASKAHSTLLHAYRHSRYDQDDLALALQKSGLDQNYQGFGALNNFFNFVPLPYGTLRKQNSALSDGTPKDIQTQRGDLISYVMPSFGIIVKSDRLDVNVRMFADPAVASPSSIHQIVVNTLENLWSM